MNADEKLVIATRAVHDQAKTAVREALRLLTMPEMIVLQDQFRLEMDNEPTAHGRLRAMLAVVALQDAMIAFQEEKSDGRGI